MRELFLGKGNALYLPNEEVPFMTWSGSHEPQAVTWKISNDDMTSTDLKP